MSLEIDDRIGRRENYKRNTIPLILPLFARSVLSYFLPSSWVSLSLSVLLRLLTHFLSNWACAHTRIPHGKGICQTKNLFPSIGLSFFSRWMQLMQLPVASSRFTVDILLTTANNDNSDDNSSYVRCVSILLFRSCIAPAAGHFSHHIISNNV